MTETIRQQRHRLKKRSERRKVHRPPQEQRQSIVQAVMEVAMKTGHRKVVTG